MENSTSNSLKELQPGELDKIIQEEWKTLRKKTRVGRFIVWAILSGCVVWEIIWICLSFQRHELPGVEVILGIHWR